MRKFGQNCAVGKAVGYGEDFIERLCRFTSYIIILKSLSEKTRRSIDPQTIHNCLYQSFKLPPPVVKTAILQKYADYDQQVQTLLEDFAQYSDEQLNRPPANGGWSPIQVLHHLILTDELSLAYIRKKLSFNPTLEKVGLGNHWRSLLLTVFLQSPFKFKAPAMIGDSNLPAFATLADTRNRWERARRDWQQYLPEIPDQLLDKQVYKHPFAGRLSWLQTVDFIHGHFRRHRKQAWRALASAGL